MLGRARLTPPWHLIVADVEAQYIEMMCYTECGYTECVLGTVRLTPPFSYLVLVVWCFETTAVLRNS